MKKLLLLFVVCLISAFSVASAQFYTNDTVVRIGNDGTRMMDVYRVGNDGVRMMDTYRVGNDGIRTLISTKRLDDVKVGNDGLYNDIKTRSGTELGYDDTLDRTSEIDPINTASIDEKRTSEIDAKVTSQAGPTVVDTNYCSLSSRSFASYVSYFSCQVKKIVLPMLITLAVLFFTYGIVKMLTNVSNAGAQEKGRAFMLWGIISFFVMISVYALVSVINNSVGVKPATSESYNQLQEKVKSLK